MIAVNVASVRCAGEGREEWKVECLGHVHQWPTTQAHSALAWRWVNFLRSGEGGGGVLPREEREEEVSEVVTAFLVGAAEAAAAVGDAFFVFFAFFDLRRGGGLMVGLAESRGGEEEDVVGFGTSWSWFRGAEGGEEVVARAGEEAATISSRAPSSSAFLARPVVAGSLVLLEEVTRFFFLGDGAAGSEASDALPRFLVDE